MGALLKCISSLRIVIISYLKVSRIIVNRTNFPSKGTTRDVGGIISASNRKNTVNESKMLIERLTYNKEKVLIVIYELLVHYWNYWYTAIYINITFSPLSDGR